MTAQPYNCCCANQCIQSAIPPTHLSPHWGGTLAAVSCWPQTAPVAPPAEPSAKGLPRKVVLRVETSRPAGCCCCQAGPQALQRCQRVCTALFLHASAPAATEVLPTPYSLQASKTQAGTAHSTQAVTVQATLKGTIHHIQLSCMEQCPSFRIYPAAGTLYVLLSTADETSQLLLRLFCCCKAVVTCPTSQAGSLRTGLHEQLCC